MMASSVRLVAATSASATLRTAIALTSWASGSSVARSACPPGVRNTSERRRRSPTARRGTGPPCGRAAGGCLLLAGQRRSSLQVVYPSKQRRKNRQPKDPVIRGGRSENQALPRLWLRALSCPAAIRHGGETRNGEAFTF